MISYKTISKFDKDFKTLLKRFKTLDTDFKIFKQFTIETYYEQNIDTNAFIPIEKLCGNDFIVFKVKKFACKSIKNKGANSGIRIIFLWNKTDNSIIFLEIYFKADKENEDKDRIKQFIKDNDLK